MTGPTALELTALALAPWASSFSRVTAEQAIKERTLYNAREGWDMGDTISSNWLSDQPDDVMRNLAMLAISASCIRDSTWDVDAAVDRLAQRFVEECSQCYREQSIRELTEGYE
jgi:hypothetical protein